MQREVVLEESEWLLPLRRHRHVYEREGRSLVKRGEGAREVVVLTVLLISGSGDDGFVKSLSLKEGEVRTRYGGKASAVTTRIGLGGKVI